jgi:glycine oxidase
MSSSPEVAVIGAGVIGCACAHELAAAGARVSVFDVRGLGGGATQASAGVLAPFIEGHETSALRELGRRSLELYDEFVDRVVAISKQSIQYTRNGTLEIALDDDEAGRLQNIAAALQREKVDARWLGSSELREAEPLAATGARGGLLIPRHGFVGVPDLTSALAAAAMQAGATFALETRVLSVAPEADGRLVVHTQNGPSSADCVVIAAGSWAGQLQIDGVAAVDVKPVRGQLLHLAWPTEQPLRHVLWGTECYIVPWLSGRVLVGATVEDAGFDERATAAGVRDLLEAGCSLVPHLWQASFAEVRVGLRPRSPDGLPIVGRSAVVPGLVYATGHYRNGVLLAPLTAALVKDLILGTGTDPALDQLNPARLGSL